MKRLIFFSVLIFTCFKAHAETISISTDPTKVMIQPDTIIPPPQYKTLEQLVAELNALNNGLAIDLKILNQVNQAISAKQNEINQATLLGLK